MRTAPATRTCAVCGKTIHRKSARGPWPKYCEEHQSVGARNNPFTLQLIDDHRARGCAVCGLSEPRCVVHLHHVDPRTKEVNIALMKWWGPERAVVELAKTIPLCANHHAILHWELEREGRGMDVWQIVDHIRDKYRHTLRYLP